MHRKNTNYITIFDSCMEEDSLVLAFQGFIGFVTGYRYRDPAENSRRKFSNRQKTFDGIQSKITKLITTM